MSEEYIPVACHISQRIEILRQTIAPTIIKLLEEVLVNICEPSSTFPTINPDGEGGISAVWHAGRYSLEVIIDNDLDCLATMSSPENSTVCITLDCEKAKKRVKVHLARLSAHVNKYNPSWRELLKTP